MIRPVMPLILAVDTTSEYGSLALVRDGELLEEALLHAPASFSPVLYEELARLLKRHGVELAEVSCFAAASGPGTFTGVRVALGCVKGLAEAMGRPAVAVSNLQAVARYGTARLRGVALDARRSEIYGAVYDDAGKLVTEEVVAKFGPWLETLPDGVEEFLSNDLTVTLEGTRFAGARAVMAPRQLAGAIGRIAGERLARGEASDAAALDANYVRRTDAELALKV
jgi:tRNA threonylcarbamoyladenosine biosynthesis protein TsaB